MGRASVHLREAVEADVPALVELWAPVLRRGEPAEQERELRDIVAEAHLDPTRRIVVAEIDSALAGAVYLRLTTVTPLNRELIVQAVSPHVVTRFRKHGVGTALLEAAASFAEECSATHVASAAFAGDRAANRFLARLALGPVATLRLAPTAQVRAKLSLRRGGSEVDAKAQRQIAKVLAARRGQRREQMAAG